MNNKDAIKILQELPDRILMMQLPLDINWDYKEALNLAIKALEGQKPQGEWEGINEYIKHLEKETSERYTEKRRRIAELDNECEGYCSPDLISKYSEQEIGQFISIDEVRKLQRVNSAIRYMQNIWGGDHDTYTKILVDYIKELEAKLERSSNQDT